MHFNKRTAFILLSFALIVGIPMLPAPEGLTTSAMQVIGIFFGVLTLWLTLSIDWPSILAIAALAFVPELTVNQILVSSFGNATFSFLLFTFLVTYALSQTSFLRRSALAFVNSRAAQRGPWSFAILFFLSALILGLFLSPTVLFIIYLPICKEIRKVLALKDGDTYGSMLMMGTTFSIAISSGVTPIAHVFSIMAMGFYEVATGLTISTFDYIAFGSVVGILTFSAMLLLFRFVLRPDTTSFSHASDTTLDGGHAVVQRREWIVLAVFAGVVLLWVAPDLLTFFGSSLGQDMKWIGTALPPMLGAVALMMLTDEGKPILSFKDALSKGVSWPPLIMTASTLALGSAMTNESIGISLWLTDTIGPGLQGMAPIFVVLLLTLWAALQTNLSSNMVTVTVVCGVGIPIAMASAGAVNPAAIASIVGLMGAFAFATPPAHPNVALAGSSGMTTPKELLFYGGILMVCAVLITTFVGYPIAASMM